MMLLCTNLGNLWVTLFHQIYKYTFPKRKYSIYNSKNPPKYHPVDMFCHKKYMVWFMVRTILNSPNPELNLRFGSGILVNCELNLWFGSGWFRFEPTSEPNFSITRPTGDTVELDGNGNPKLPSASWVDAGENHLQDLSHHLNANSGVTACKDGIGGALGVKDSMIAHILGKNGNKVWATTLKGNENSHFGPKS